MATALRQETQNPVTEISHLPQLTLNPEKNRAIKAVEMAGSMLEQAGRTRNSQLLREAFIPSINDPDPGWAIPEPVCIALCARALMNLNLPERPSICTRTDGRTSISFTLKNQTRVSLTFNRDRTALRSVMAKNNNGEVIGSAHETENLDTAIKNFIEDVKAYH